MAKIYVHKDLVARLQCDSHRRRFGWLYGSIASHSEGKHIHIKEYSHHAPKECPRGGEAMNNDSYDQAAEAQQQQQEAFSFPSSTTDGILGWYIVFNYTPSDTATAQQVQEEQELMVKHTFRQMHLQLMKYLIKNNIQDEKMRKQFGMLIGLVINGRTLTEQRDEMVQVFKNQVRVYSVYTTDLYMQALFEHALKCIDPGVNHQNHKNGENGGSSSSEQVPVFDHALTLKRDLSLFVQSGQMSQFFRNERQMNISNDFLNSEQFISGEMYETALSSFGGRFFDIAKVEEFCKSAMSANDDLVDQYEELYNENQRLSLQLSILNEQVRNIQRHSDIQVSQSSQSASQEMSLPLAQQVIYGESVVNQ